MRRAVAKVDIGSLAAPERGAFKIGPFGSSLKKSELVPKGISVVGIENVLANEFVRGGSRFITREKFTELANYAIRPGDVLVTRMGTIGRAAVAPSDLGPAIIDFHLFRMRVDQRQVTPSYLCHALNSGIVAAQLKTMAHGAIMDGLNATIVRACRIPLPSVAEQRRIVALLDMANRLRRTRRYALELGATLMAAKFRERFGRALDHSANGQLGEVVKITGGGTPSRARPEYFEGRTPWLTSKDMRGDYIWDTEEHVTEEAIASSATKVVPADSILVVVKSKVLMHRLPVAIAKVPICHGQDIKSIQCSGALHYEFARFLLKYHEPRLLNLARGANTEGLTLPMLEGLPVPDVKYEDQLKFANAVQQHERLRGAQREALRQADHLCRSLLQRAFEDPL